MTEATTTRPCRWCGAIHGPLCPWVKALEFEHGGNTVKRVEFFAPVEFGPPPRVEQPGESEREYPRKGA